MIHRIRNAIRSLTILSLSFAALNTLAAQYVYGQTQKGGPSNFHWHLDIDSGNFSAESHTGNDIIIRKQDRQVINIQNGSWIAFNQFDFGASLAYFWIEVASDNVDGAVELRVDSPDGPLLGVISIRETGGMDNYKPFGLTLPRPVKGVHDLYLRFVGEKSVGRKSDNKNDNLFNIARFRFQRLSPDYVSPNPVDDAETRVLSEGFTAAGNFTSESHPSDDNKVREDGGKIGYIQNENWVAYKDFDFGSQPKYFAIEASSESMQNKLELRLDKPDGVLIGSVDITSTGSFKTFRLFGTSLKRPVKGVHDLYFKFSGKGGYIFDLGAFRFLSVAPGLKQPESIFVAAKFEKESHPQSETVSIENNEVTSIKNGSWIAYSNFDFGQQTNLITIEAATPNNGGFVEIRTGTADGPLIGTVDITHTGSWTHYRPFTAALSQSTSGLNHLFLKFVSPDGSKESLFNLRSFVFGRKAEKPDVSKTEGTLNVYPPVPGLAPSPYYEFSVQKLSSINATAKENATNWERPFAWFTRCIDFVPNKESAYYEEFIGGWSHTYCNFEMDVQTPIVVKISRLTKSGAPSGPITMANVHPRHKVISCEIIKGDVYVTMSNPALVAIDIDGQMDTRDAPRLIPNKWGPDPFPYGNESNGVHGVTIFANPVLQDKPSLTDPTVYSVKPGTLPPSDGPWKTLYFLPGVHKLSVDANGKEREWVGSDAIVLRNNKNYYIPGDAILYGNLNDWDDELESVNVRVYGHGTISGTKIPHWKDFSFGELPAKDHKKLRMLQLTRGSNCTYEGVTIADPAEHGVYIQGHGFNHAPNKISWVKNISWRVNNDGGGVTGNSVVEDCFFRHQDDALYVRGIAIRRCVMWSDVNGTPLRCSFITNDRGPDYPNSLPPDLVIEDCDIIYARGVFAFDNSADFGVIGTPGSFDNTKTYADGTVNTGQHILFRNIRVTDPRPTRFLFGFHATGDKNDPQKVAWAGIRFENIEYRHPQTWGWKNRLLGSSVAPIRNWSFDDVVINGRPLDAQFLDDPKLIETSNVSDMRFTPPRRTR